eukprot:5344689-Alexandrium_andersonii.AAC.1
MRTYRHTGLQTYKRTETSAGRHRYRGTGTGKPTGPQAFRPPENRPTDSHTYRRTNAQTHFLNACG